MKKLALLFIPLLVFASCELVQFDEDLNKNPNDPSEASNTQLLANAMLWLPGMVEDPQGEYFSQFLSKTIYQDNSFYPERGYGFYSLYEGPLYNVERVIKNAATDNQLAVAKILKAYFFWQMTDRWGPIPFREALQGIDEITPAYDSQAVIYDSLFVMLENANSLINTSGTLQDDIIYGGDMAKWKKLANTMRLLMALRLSEVDEARAQQEFTAALNAGIMESNADNFVFQNLANVNNQSFWYGQIVEPPVREWWAISEGLMSLMRPVDDPRLPVYADTTGSVTGSNYNGLTFGTEGTITLDNYSLLGDAIHTQDASVYLITYAQAVFAKAEAAQRGWITGSAASFYNEAVTVSIEMWTGSSSGAATFLVQPEIAFNPTTAIEQIATQRYVHLFMNGFEAWSEWRRLGYPQTMEKPLGRDVPLRLMYASEEEFNNTENYEEAVSMLDNGNSFYSPLWWDVD